tara:strand:- start:615 stop:989 length:375 start_codon:yes stop_codon:yes gene_type:complete
MAENARITWDSEVNAPGCAGQIVADDGRTLLVQLDYDHPGVASSFGWSVRDVQRCNYCGTAPDWCDGSHCHCDNCGARWPVCQHNGTDGTIDCDCGVTASDFITEAGEYLDGADGETADDPGYF